MIKAGKAGQICSDALPVFVFGKTSGLMERVEMLALYKAILTFNLICDKIFITSRRGRGITEECFGVSLFM